MAQHKYPDFYIIGAPKCGTTALYKYLTGHPSVFMPRLKEPHFFSPDFPSHRKVHTAQEYLELFSNAPHGAITGEASVWYLYSQLAVQQITQVKPDAKFIIMLRNPVEVVQSLHAQQLVVFIEDIIDFEKAWRAQDDRALGRRIPLHCSEPSHLQYGKVCAFSEQVERVLRAVPRNQLLTLVYERFFSDPISEYRKVLKFLGLPFDGRINFERVNLNQLPGNIAVHRFITRPPRIARPVLVLLRGISRRLGLRLGVLSRRLSDVQVRERPPIRRALQQELEEFFAAEISRLELIIEQPLEIWRSPARPQRQLV